MSFEVDVYQQKSSFYSSFITQFSQINFQKKFTQKFPEVKFAMKLVTQVILKRI